MAPWVALSLASALLLGCGSSGPTMPTPRPPAEPAALTLESFPPLPPGPAPGASPQAWELARSLNAGINFGNMLEPPREGDWGLTVTQEFIDLIGPGGFTQAVRLPVRWSNHASADAAAVIDEKFFQRVDGVLNALLAKGATVVLDMHHYRQFDGDALDPGEAPVPDAVVDVRLLSMWKQIAQRYAKHSPRLIFEIYNEPHGRSEPRWNDMLSRALRVIRQFNPERAVVIGPTHWNSATRLNDLVLPPDRNLIITIHHYEPFDFTHQGAEWITPPKPTGVDCCNAAQTQQIHGMLDLAADYSRKTGYPVFVGEFGAYSKASTAARVRYLQTLRSAMQARQIPWMYWELAAGFGLYDPAAKAFRTDLKAALYPTP
jgi:endoglucanase